MTINKSSSSSDNNNDIIICVNFDMIDAVNETWQIIKKIPNYEQIAGENLFRKIFEIAPVALTLYPFGTEFKGREEEELYKSKVFIRHAKVVVKMLDEAVNMLGPDMDPITHTLTELGARHVNYGVVPAHYAIVGQALLFTLETALSSEVWNSKRGGLAKQGWTAVYGFVSTAMIAGANRQLELCKKQNKRLRQKIETAREIKIKGTSSKQTKGKKQKYHQSNNSRQLVEIDKVIKSVPGLKHNIRKSQQESATLLKDKEQVMDVIDNVLQLNTTTAHYTTTDDDTTDAGDDNISITSSISGSTDASSQQEQEESYHIVIENVYQSWDKIKSIPDYEKVAGTLLFKKIFDIAPAAKGLYSFYDANNPDLEGDAAFYEHPAFVRHAVGVVRMLDAAVNMLGPDLDLVASALEGLGARHVTYGVIPDHYPIVGKALLETLEAALGDSGWTNDVQLGWTTIYSFVSSTMIKGATDSMQQKMKMNTATTGGEDEKAAKASPNLVAFQLLHA